METLQLNDFGARFLATFLDQDDAVFDISDLDVSFLFRKPDGVNFYRAGTYLTDGTDGKAYYIMTSGELNALGIWRVQGFLNNNVDKGLGSGKYSFRVVNNLDDE